MSFVSNASFQLDNKNLRPEVVAIRCCLVGRKANRGGVIRIHIVPRKMRVEPKSLAGSNPLVTGAEASRLLGGVNQTSIGWPMPDEPTMRE
jgi:hypothetical protein